MTSGSHKIEAFQGFFLHFSSFKVFPGPMFIFQVFQGFQCPFATPDDCFHFYTSLLVLYYLFQVPYFFLNRFYLAKIIDFGVPEEDIPVILLYSEQFQYISDSPCITAFINRYHKVNLKSFFYHGTVHVTIKIYKYHLLSSCDSSTAGIYMIML